MQNWKNSVTVIGFFLGYNSADLTCLHLSADVRTEIA